MVNGFLLFDEMGARVLLLFHVIKRSVEVGSSRPSIIGHFVLISRRTDKLSLAQFLRGLGDCLCGRGPALLASALVVFPLRGRTRILVY